MNNSSLSDSCGRAVAGLTVAEVEQAVAKGGRFVVYEYCVSILVASLRGQSRVDFRRPGQGSRWPGVPYALLSLLCGWWGVPWGFIYTPLAILSNLSGGHDVTSMMVSRMKAAASNETG